MRHNVIALLLACIITTTAHGASAGASCFNFLDRAFLIKSNLSALTKAFQDMQESIDKNNFHELMSDPDFWASEETALNKVHSCASLMPECLNFMEEAILRHPLEILLEKLSHTIQAMARSLSRSYPEEEATWVDLSNLLTISSATAEEMTLDALHARLKIFNTRFSIINSIIISDERIDKRMRSFLEHSAQAIRDLVAPGGVPRIFASEADFLATYCNTLETQTRDAKVLALSIRDKHDA
jgi:hypothetical protein